MLGEIEFIYEIGNVIVSKTSYHPHMYMSHHIHELPYISIVLEGSYTKVRAAQPEKLNRSMLAFHPAGEAHADCVHGSRVSTVNFELRQCALPSDFYAFQGAAVDYLCGGVLDALRGRGQSAASAIWAIVEHVCTGARRAETAPAPLADVRASLGSFDRPESVSALARRFGVHRSALHRAFSKTYGCSPREERSRTRAAAAARLLSACDVPLAEIALECGYYDQSHFCRQFKHAVGMTPTAFRSRFS